MLRRKDLPRMKKAILLIPILFILFTSCVFANNKIDGMTVEGLWQDRTGHQLQIRDSVYGRLQNYQVIDVLRENGKTTVVLYIKPECFRLYLTFNDDNPNYFMANGTMPNRLGANKPPFKIARDYVRVLQ